MDKLPNKALWLIFDVLLVGTVHLSGYLMPEEEEYPDDMEEFSEEEADAAEEEAEDSSDEEEEEDSDEEGLYIYTWLHVACAFGNILVYPW